VAVGRPICFGPALSAALVVAVIPGLAWAQALMAPSLRPDRVEFSTSSRTVHVSVMWAPIASSTVPQPVGFDSNDALEVEIRLAERYFLVPRTGRDIVSDLADANVCHNFPDDVAVSAYVDPWNYYVPPNGIEASDQIATYCPGIVEIGALAIQTLVDLDRDPETNFSIGIRRPDLLLRGRWYRFGYPVVRSDSSFVPDCPRSVDASRARIRFELIPNTCTYFGVHTDCPFVLGFPRCDEFTSNPREHFVYWTRICAPTGPLALESVEATADRSDDGGMCVDGDDDGWFAVNSAGYTMYGTLASDCADGDASIHPGAEDACENAVDEDCDGMDASCSASCTGSASGSSALWTCTNDLRSRQRCIEGAVETEECSLGCLERARGTDDVCDESSCASSEAGSCSDGIDNDCDSTLDCGDDECRGLPACAGACTPLVHRRCWVECPISYPSDPDCVVIARPPVFVGHEPCASDGTWTGTCAVSTTCELYTRSCTAGVSRATPIACGNGTELDGSMDCLMMGGTGCSYAFYSGWAVDECSDFCDAPDDRCARTGDTRPCRVSCGAPGGPTVMGIESCDTWGCGSLHWGMCDTGGACP